MTSFVQTVGESVTIETIKSLKANTPSPHRIIVWYSVNNGGEPNQGFISELRKYTKDVIVDYNDIGMAETVGLLLLYIKDEFILYSQADTIVPEGYYEKMMKFFEDETVGIVGNLSQGQINHLEGAKFVVSDPEFNPDTVKIFRKKMVNDIGSICPSYRNWGEFMAEYYNRILADDKWKIVGGDFGVKHNEVVHGGRINNERWEEQAVTAQELFMRCKAKGFKDYNWWSSVI